MDAAKFSKCVRGSAAAKQVDSDIALAQANEVNSSPTVFVNSLRLYGVASSEQLRTLIHQLANPNRVASLPLEVRTAAATTTPDIPGDKCRPAPKTSAVP